MYIIKYTIYSKIILRYIIFNLPVCIFTELPCLKNEKNECLPNYILTGRYSLLLEIKEIKLEYSRAVNTVPFHTASAGILRVS